MKKQFAKEFIDFSYRGKSVYHVVKSIEELFIEKGYIELGLTDKWDIDQGGKYYVKRNDSTIIVFSVGGGERTFKITTNHTDTPGFKIKPSPVSISEKNYLRLNTEVYGGPILNTWMDRPLSMAGRIMVKGGNALEPEVLIVDIDRPLLVIPNLAIHQNRNVNEGVKLSKQSDMLPVAALINQEINNENFILDILSMEYGIEKDEILDMELFLYEYTKGTLTGVNEEFISCGKVDNLASTYAGAISMLECPDHSGINVLACFDNEEIGSRTKQGADSNLLLNIMERIILSLDSGGREEFFRVMYRSFMVSVDGAHAVHPAKGEKTDITNRPMLNNGPAIKINAAHSYTTDAFSGAVVKSIFNSNELPYQYFVNHSDERGGSTLGPVSAGHIDIDSADLGLPMLAMHSIREMCGVDDLYSLKEFLKGFYSL
ncbi:M18 family aminopeptidase [uncultured Ilyobacter sp.]|uniref:M18 family aminopeptidase n=1 Tax=uncultured Ilyobacter sp. TaxID=544433 RepID=UPI0029C8D450|nr:M18 family aminopeptidase [uncultured Ilyobacter sp.]